MLEIESTSDRRATVRRARTVVAVVAIAMVTGTLGFAIGRAAGDGQSNRAAGAITEDDSTVTALSPREGPPVTDAPSTTDAATTETTPSERAADASLPSGAMASGAMASGAMGGGGQYTPGAYPDMQRDLVAERTTDDGVTMRAHLARSDPSMSNPYAAVGDGSWTPAGWCFPSGDVRISVITPTSTNVSWGPWYDEPKDGLAVTSFSTGYVEGDPMFGVAVQVDADATSVTFTTASGAADTTAPINGLALLVVHEPIEDDFSVDVTHASGDTTTAGVADLTQPWSSVEYQSACEPPPPALPDAGDQPADPAAARAAIDESWRVAHDRDSDVDVRAASVDDATGLADAWDALQNGEYAEAARTSTTTFRELVFTSPTEAWFRYDIETSITDFANRYGMARLGDDGVWRITRQTICQDIALAPGFGCTPTVDTLYPPSAANDPRYGGTLTDEGVRYEE